MSRVKKGAFYGLYIFILAVFLTILNNRLNYFSLVEGDIYFILLFFIFLIGYIGLAFFLVRFFSSRSMKDKGNKTPVSIEIFSIIFYVLSFFQLIFTAYNSYLIYNFIRELLPNLESISSVEIFIPLTSLMVYFIISLFFTILFLKTGLALHHGDKWALDLMILSLISIIFIPIFFDFTNYFLVWIVIALVLILTAYILTNKNVKKHFHED